MIAGKVRRFALIRFRPGYVARQAALREGECNRCGRCCKILFRCPFLKEEEGGESHCRIYGQRFEQCVAFPIDDRDLADVDFNCTYSFRKTGLIQIDLTGLEVGFDGPPPEAFPRRRSRLGGLRKVGIVQMIAAVIAVIRERV
ncbi:MAG: hypothetical protein A3F84_02435 [Candidatus Handelsmanbacteria bacterium RIFCSPLOWO2_12_FULL_64_10]|uniref:Uncharacterized protein n=1 Tax=Handelsmanbacteria sp. (strain RIFCSPLOWO2_12_FULL_64_10) TaxID=1817868 RepID=A0A1F6CBE7_HANXR|nr:MAG: hypothetical protein A3F84_02435 [Candidatus Handelsmanbacteria bacterium RIFCSPLOWO2_12_FULL_64_10]